LFGLLTNPARTEVITCEVQNVEFFFVGNLTQSCVINKEKIAYNSVVSDSNTANIEGFKIKDKKYLGFLPINVGKTFPLLKAIEVYGCSFAVIEAKYFTDLRGLISINLPHNEMKEIESDVFTDKPNLKWLSLAGNKLRSLDEKHFHSLQNIACLYLHSNLFETLPHNLLKDLINLKDLSLANNELITLSEDFFESNDKLEIIRLNNNSILFLSPKLFLKKINLSIVSLTNNRCINQDFDGKLTNDATMYNAIASHCAPPQSTTPFTTLGTSPYPESSTTIIPESPGKSRNALIIIASCADIICLLSCAMFLYQYSRY
jgi:Leucine rich repeat